MCEPSRIYRQPKPDNPKIDIVSNKPQRLGTMTRNHEWLMYICIPSEYVRALIKQK